MKDTSRIQVIGSSPPRADAWAKVAGEARFLADLPARDAWVGGTVRAPIPHGRLRAVRRDPRFDWSRVALLTAEDLPGPNTVAMIRDDMPILADGMTRFLGEPVALVAAPDRETLAQALAAVRLDIVELSPVLAIEAALSRPLLAEAAIRQGDAAKALETADRIIEGTYRTGHQEHLYLEPNGILATPRPEGGVEVCGSLQCPYYVHRALVTGLRLAPEQVVIRQTATGGAFGGKEDYPSILALHAALLALQAGRPVAMILDRTEDMQITPKRHPALIRHRTGVMRDGRLVAAEIDVVLDGGAYTTLSPVVLSRSILHAAGPYRLPHALIRGRAVATHTPPNGAFRGFGAPQSQFACERQMDRIARELGLSPLAVRRRNLLRDGDEL
ncbi:MAG: molybdopterin-dependent oxidoreductase, partial [Candidatus Eisenbacteria bacterium]|nr:molybdopterin-dependent oxidoreductase [Candidatus Eisenbacteria bacterium]